MGYDRFDCSEFVLILGVITATIFKPGLGACGIANGPGDFIAAASHQLFDTFPYVLTYIDKFETSFF